MRNKFDKDRMSKKQQGKMLAALGQRISSFFGLDKVEFGIAPKIKGSKYKPHQGAQEKARRVKQGLAGMNCHVTAQPSQDFSNSHYGCKKRKAVIELRNG